MKKSVMTALVGATFLMSVASQAATPKKLGTQSMALLNVLAAVPSDLSDLMKHGNTITDATIEQSSGEYARYRITARHCQLRGGCIGGAMLTIDQMRGMTPGLFPAYSYETQLTLLR